MILLHQLFVFIFFLPGTLQWDGLDEIADVYKRQAYVCFPKLANPRCRAPRPAIAGHLLVNKIGRAHV